MLLVERSKFGLNELLGAAPKHLPPLTGGSLGEHSAADTSLLHLRDQLWHA